MQKISYKQRFPTQMKLTVRFCNDQLLETLVHNFFVEDEQTKRAVTIPGVYNLIRSSTKDPCHRCTLNGNTIERKYT